MRRGLAALTLAAAAASCGSPKDDAAVGTIIGPGFRAEAVPQAIDTIVDTYLAKRADGETFLDTWRRVGAQPFKEALYGAG